MCFSLLLGKNVPYFNFNYKEESIPQYFLHQWKTSEDIDPTLHLPPCNELMPTSFYEVLEGHLGYVEEENNDESYFERIGLKYFYKDDEGILSEASLNIYLNPGVGVISHTICRIFFEKHTSFHNLITS